MSLGQIANFFTNGFWKGLNIGHVAIIGIALIGWGRFEEQFSEIIKTQARQQLQMDEMNKNGTFHSNETEIGQKAQIDELRRRTENDEQVLQQIVPKLERVDANVLILMNRR